jgi:trehalose utilization protein
VVADEVVDRVQKQVLEGMGLLVLHSGYYSKIFEQLLGTTCSLTWREAGEKERLWICNPGHHIARGLGRHFELEMEEMYGGPFAIPPPEEQVFISHSYGLTRAPTCQSSERWRKLLRGGRTMREPGKPGLR